MRKRFLVLAVLGIVCAVLILWRQWENTVDLGEELPVKINAGNIICGKVRAYHPDILYRKYRLAFMLNNGILTQEITVEPEKKLTAKQFYYYMKQCSELTMSKKMVIDNDAAQSYIEYVSPDSVHYLFTVSGDHSGSANFRNIRVKLYKIQNERADVVFDREETYSVDPGIDSNYCSERIKLLIYRSVIRDNRYRIGVP